MDGLWIALFVFAAGLLGFCSGYMRGSLGGYKRGLAGVAVDDRELHKAAVMRLRDRMCEAASDAAWDGARTIANDYLAEMERQAK